MESYLVGLALSPSGGGDLARTRISLKFPLKFPVFQVRDGDSILELLSESFDENGRKTSEYAYPEPILIWKFPLERGTRYSDAKSVSGYDNLAGIERIEAIETRQTEVIAKETLLMPAKIEVYRLRSWGTSHGTIRMAGATSRIIVSHEENSWYSPEVKDVVKSETITTTVVMLPTVTSITRTREMRVLESYA